METLEEAGRSHQAEYLRLELAAVNQQRRIDVVGTIREVTRWGLSEVAAATGSAQAPGDIARRCRLSPEWLRRVGRW